jgi:hypothetical protein
MGALLGAGDLLGGPVLNQTTRDGLVQYRIVQLPLLRSLSPPPLCQLLGLSSEVLASHSIPRQLRLIVPGLRPNASAIWF